MLNEMSVRRLAGLWTSYRLSSARRMAEAVVGPSVKCIGPPRRAAQCARPCHGAEHRLAPVTLCGLLDSPDARRSAEGRSGPNGWPLISLREGSDRRPCRCTVVGVEQGLTLQQDTGDPEQPVADAAQGPAIGVATRPQG